MNLLPLSTPSEMAAFEAACLADWMKKVDDHIAAACGWWCNIGDLPHYDYAAAFHDGASPKEAAKAAIKAANE